MTKAAEQSFDDLVADRLPGLPAAEARVAVLLRDHRQDILLSSAAALAARAGTSDATVIRTVRALGFAGLDAMRRRIVDETGRRLTQADRLVATLAEVGSDAGRAFATALDLHAEALAALRRDIADDLFQNAATFLAEAPRTLVFGIGPTSCIAEYLVIQLRRFGLAADALTRTGLLAADDLNRLRDGDRVLVFAYGRFYPEVGALLNEAERLGLPRMLVTDTLGPTLRHRFDIVVAAPRGRTEMLSMHTATLALLEALLLGIAAARPDAVVRSLERLNGLRGRIASEVIGPQPAKRRRLSGRAERLDS